MLNKFYEDLAKAKKGEAIVLEVLRNVATDYDFNDVSDDARFYYRGDIEVYDQNWDAHYYMDVKMDGCIGRTHNILCEEKVWMKEGSYYSKGNMQSDYDYLAILSVDTQRIFIIDFNKLKQHYKEGKNYYKDHGDQITYGRLFPLNKAWKYNMVKAVIAYEQRNGKYMPVKVVS